MDRRQTSIPRAWLVADERLGDRLWETLLRLPRGSGVLVLYRAMPGPERSRLLVRVGQVARKRGLVVADELAGEAARVHDATEIRDAQLARVPLLFLSPMFATRSHPELQPLTRMRAAALARLATVPVIGLGGMSEKRFRRIGSFGLYGWAAIDSWIRT